MNDRRSVPGLSSTGFIAVVGSTRAATAWSHCARPISPPSRQTIELFDMFCALNGATRTPRRTSARHSPATMTYLPASDDVPATRRPEGAAGVGTRPSCRTTPQRHPTVLRCTHAAAPGRRRQPGPARPAVRRRLPAGCVGLEARAPPARPAGPPARARPDPAEPVARRRPRRDADDDGCTVRAAPHRAAHAGAARGRVGRHRLPLRLGDAAGVVLQPPRAPAGLARGRRRRAPGQGRAGPGARQGARARGGARVLPRLHGLRGTCRWARPRLLRAAPRARLSALGYRWGRWLSGLLRVAVGEQAVELASGLREDLRRLRALLGGAGRDDLPHPAHDLADEWHEVVGTAGGAGRLLLGRLLEGPPGGGHLLGVLLDVGATRVGEAQQSPALDVAALDEAFVLELLDGRVDRAGARLPRTVRALGDLLDELVAVHLVAREDVEDGGADVAASGAGSAASAELRAEAGSAEVADEVGDPRGRAGAATAAGAGSSGTAPGATTGSEAGAVALASPAAAPVAVPAGLASVVVVSVHGGSPSTNATHEQSR